MSELLPCPFCGGEANTVLRNADDWHVECHDCAAKSGTYGFKKYAIEAWNTRAERTCRMYRRGTSTDNRECSECGASYRGDVLYPLNFCPSCGAKVIP